MGDKTNIEWTDATWNPVSGCTKVSAGCKHCYAERDWHRLASNPTTPRYNGRAFTDVQCHPEMLDQPLRWKRPRRIFVNSMSDLFHEAVPFEFIAKVFAAMSITTRHTYQVLTKRPARMLEFFRWLEEQNDQKGLSTSDSSYYFPEAITDATADVWPSWKPYREGKQGGYDNCGPVWPLENVWIGVTAETQEAADERIPLLLQAPAAVRFVSVEPLIGPLMLDTYLGDLPEDEDGAPYPGRLHWVIVGGESGPKARPMHPDWVRSLRDQCAAAGVPFMFKQWGGWSPAPQGATAATIVHDFDDGVRVFKVGKKAAGRLLDGREHLEYPNPKQ